MKRRMLLGIAAFGGLTACSRPQFFNIGWDEEVKLHDGRVIVVNLKFTYERLDRFSEYGKAILRDTVLTFDAGQPLGRVLQVFKRMRPALLNQLDGTWYAVIEEIGAGGSPTISGQDWGPMQTGQGQRTIKLAPNGFTVIPIQEFPDQLVECNLLRDYAPIEELARFDRRLVDLNAKASYSNLYRTHPDDVRLVKPQLKQTN